MKKFKKIITVFCAHLFLLPINLKPDITFDNLTSTFQAQNSNSKIYFNYSSTTIFSSNFKNGFQIPSGKTVVFNTTLPVSGLLDLSGTLSLGSDLSFATELTYSGIGSIAGNGNAINLGGNLTIPNSNFFHIGSDTIIEGNGNAINLSDNAEILIDDNVTLTLRNIVVNSSKNGVGNPAIKLTSNRSKLALDNTVLNMANDFYVDRGQLFIHNDVSFTGTNALVYRSTVPSYITSNSTLNFDINSIFDFRPSTTGTPQLLAKDLLFMQDATSQFYLNGCTIKSTYTGIRLTKGQLLFDNKISMTSAAAFRLSDFSTTVTNWQATARAACVDWHPSGKYIAFGVDNGLASAVRFVVLGFNGTSFTQIAQTATWSTFALGVNWSSDGKYLACAGGDTYNTIVYSFDGKNLTQIASAGASSRAWTARWSPDGKYLAVASSLSSNQLAVYAFTGNSLSLIKSASLAGTANGASWSPDGKTIAVCYNTSTLAIYNFTGTALSLLNSYSITSAVDATWSPDGRFLVTSAATQTIGWIHYFTGSSLVRVASYTALSGAVSYACSWDKTGRYVAFAGQDQTTTTANAVVCQLAGNTLSLVGTFYFSTSYARGIAFSPNNNFLAIAGNVANAGFQELQIQALRWRYETQTQALSNSIVFGNSALGSTYDLNVRGLSGAQIEIDGLVNYDNVS